MRSYLSSLSPVMHGAIFVLLFLIIASFAAWLLAKLKPKGDWQELQKRIKAWWVMAIIFLAAVSLNIKQIPLVLFCLVSLLAMREYLRIFDLPKQHQPIIFWTFFIIIIQYYWIFIDWYGMFTIFIPIYAFIFLSIRLIFTKDPKDFLNSIAKIQWGLLIFGLGLSHLGYLVNLGFIKGTAIDGRCLLLFLVILTETNDVAQYIWGRLFGRTKIAPHTSPKKTWEGFIGGVITVPLIGILMRFLTPFSLGVVIVISLGISVVGFFGDLVMSALKRDRGIKDFSTAIPGHGGILDRMDSICYTAPLFFHVVRYWYY